MKKLTMVLCVMLLLADFGCSGGGGGDAPTSGASPAPIIRQYDLDPSHRYEPGYSEAWDMNGTVSELPGHTNPLVFEGTMLGTVKNKVFDGEWLTPVEIHYSGSIDDVPIPSDIYTTYFDKDLVPHSEKNLSGDTDLPTYIVAMPHDAEIGDFGELTSWLEGDGGTKVGTWQLEAGPSAYAKLTKSWTYRDSWGQTTEFEEITWTINTSGERISGSGTVVGYSTNLELEVTYTRK